MFEGTIRVGYRDYRVELWPHREAEAVGADGRCDVLNGVISVRDDLASDEAAATLIHEVLHATWKNGCIGEVGEEEKAVSILSNQLSQVIRDNPDLIAYLQEALAPSPL